MTDTKYSVKFLPLFRKFVTIIGMGLIVSSCSDQSDGEQLACNYAPELAKKLDGSISGDVAAFTLAETPVSLSSIAFVNAEGINQTLADYSGKILLVNLWATWCAPCRAEMPALEHLEAQLGGDKFSVMPISVDGGSSDKPKDFYKEIGLKKLPFLHDSTPATFKFFQKNSLALGLPATVIVDDKGCVLGKLNGPAEWGGPDAVKLMNAATDLMNSN